MTRLYEVDPANTEEIFSTDYNGRTYGAGGPGPWRTRTGNRPNQLTGAEAALDIYEANEDNATCGPYHTRVVEWSFVGTVHDDAARVQETVVCVRIDGDALYEKKLVEIGDQDEYIMFNAIDTSLHANWWLIVTERARHQLATADRAALWREHDGLAWPTGPNAPWLSIYRADNGRVSRYQVTDEPTWKTLMQELGQHDQDTSAATDASRVALDGLNQDRINAYDAAYAQAQVNNPGGTPEDWAAEALVDPAYQAAWDAVAAHDAADPAWNYPAVTELNGHAQALHGGL